MGHGWFYYFMSTSLPKFLHDIYDVPINENGWFQVVPWLTLSLVNAIILPVTENQLEQKRWTKRTIRIFYSILGLVA